MPGDERGLSAVGGEAAILGKYKLIAKLGQGGMADVFLAVAQGPASFNKLVVVKRHRSMAADAEPHVAMFLDEAKLSARLNHPNIVQTYEIGEEEGAYFIVMEYLDGQPLNRVARAAMKHERGADAFTRGVWVRVVAEMLRGLHYAHELADYDGSPLHIVHRDISPHNVFITYDGAVKVVDFGIAKAALNTVRTDTGILKGKAAYMAPEQALASRTLDRRADVFAVGIVLWELLAGRRCFEGDAVSTLAKLMKNDIPKLAAAAPDVPPELVAAVDKALAPDPNDRFATAQDMRLALEAYLRTASDDIRGDELGAKMLGVFADRRNAIRKQIKEYLDRSGADTARGPSSVRSPRSQSLPIIDDGGKSNPAQDDPRERSETKATVVVPIRSAKPGYMIAAVGLLALAAAGTLAMFRRGPGPAPSPSAAAAPTTARPAGEAVGVVRIASDPPGATVRWNGRDLGKTPLSADLPAGSQNLTLSRADFQDEALLVAVAAGGTTDRSVTLRRSAPPEGAPAPSAAPTGAEAAAPPAGARPAAWGHAAVPRAPATAEAAAATQAPAATAAPSAKPKIQVVDDGTKPMVKVDVIQ